MANSVHIEINGASSRFAGQVRGLVDSTRAISNNSTAMRAICDTYLGPNPVLTEDATYADLAVALGLVGATANAQARAFYDLLKAAEQRLTGPIISSFIDRLG